jgi:hypothetical protein
MSGQTQLETSSSIPNLAGAGLMSLLESGRTGLGHMPGTLGTVFSFSFHDSLFSFLFFNLTFFLILILFLFFYQQSIFPKYLKVDFRRNDHDDKQTRHY